MSTHRFRLRAQTLVALLVAGLLWSCEGPDSTALVVRPGSTPAPVEHTRADPVERPNYHWFGEIPLGEVAKHSFMLDNTTSRAISVVRALPSCTCLALEVKARDASGSVVAQLHEGGTRAAEIPPKGSLEVVFVVDTRKERLPNWPRLMQASIYTSDPTVPLVQLEGTFIAVTPFQMLKDHVSLGIVAGEYLATERQSITQAAKRELALTGEVLEAPADWTVRVWEDKQPQGAARSWTLQVTLPPGPNGPIAESLRLATIDASGAPAAPYVVPVRGERGPTVFASTERIFFRGGALTTSVRIASRIPIEGAAIESVTIDGPLAPALRHEVQIGASVRGKGPAWTLVLEIVGEAPTECSGRVSVRFVDDLWPALEIPYTRFP